MFVSRVESGDDVLEATDAVHARIGRAHLELLALIARVDLIEVWRDEGARDTAHLLAIRYGISEWKARRWIAAAHALQALPRISAALAQGRLGIDKVVELSRFATPETESRLSTWAERVSCGGGSPSRRPGVPCPYEGTPRDRARSVGVVVVRGRGPLPP